MIPRHLGPGRMILLLNVAVSRAERRCYANNDRESGQDKARGSPAAVGLCAGAENAPPHALRVRSADEIA